MSHATPSPKGACETPLFHDLARPFELVKKSLTLDAGRSFCRTFCGSFFSLIPRRAARFASRRSCLPFHGLTASVGRHTSHTALFIRAPPAPLPGAPGHVRGRSKPAYCERAGLLALVLQGMNIRGGDFEEPRGLLLIKVPSW